MNELEAIVTSVAFKIGCYIVVYVNIAKAPTNVKYLNEVPSLPTIG